MAGHENETGRVELPVIALRNMVTFPGVMAGLRVGRPRSRAALESAIAADGRVVLLAQKEADAEEPTAEDLYDVGTVSRIIARKETDEPGVFSVHVEGLRRCRLVSYTRETPAIIAEVEPLSDSEESVPDDLREEVRSLFSATDQGNAMLQMLGTMENPPPRDWAIAHVLDLPVEEKQRLLSTTDREQRYRMLLPVLRVEQQIEEAGRRLRGEARRSVTAEDRLDYLRMRKQQVLQELDEVGESPDSELQDLRRRLQEADLPDEAEQEAERELARLERMPTGSPEYGVAVDYLNWIIDLPWSESSAAEINLEKACEVLDRDHYDRSKVKERILEYLSVRKLRPEREGAILCFVGAPGVGKTSMGRSIAEATGRRFHRVSLGGVRDEAELRGHRRTYIGALPGRIIRALRTVGVNNPVLLLDEVDKLQPGLRGDPTAALLEVLDPEQNAEFVDSYLAVAFDLSRVMFIGTANTTDTIPAALLDRMEVIELPGYTTAEKVEIARRYLVPKQVAATGLDEECVVFKNDALAVLVDRYTQEAGVRNLERHIASACRKLAREQMGGRRALWYLDAERVVDLLGPPKYQPNRLEKGGRPGICPTLAVSAAGGELLLVEAERLAGDGKLIVTGRAGPVLRESATLALALLKGRAERLGTEADTLRKSDFHVHFPAGAQPKEGASAGLPVALALVSLLMQRPVPEDAAAIGEITLRGRVLRVERIAERLAAAGRAGIRRIVVPERNRPNIESLGDKEYLAGVRLLYVRSLDDAVGALLPRGVGARAE